MAASTVASVVGAGAAVAGAIGGKKDAKSSAKSQEEAAQAGLALTEEQFADVKERLDPFIDPSSRALDLQAALSGAKGVGAQTRAFNNFRDDPGTEFLREQGLRLIDTGAAATGGLGGGERLRALTKFSQGLALQDINNRFNRLGAVTGTGLTAAQALGGVSGQSSAAQAQLTQNAGAAQALGTLGGRQAISSGTEQFMTQLPGLIDIFDKG